MMKTSQLCGTCQTPLHFRKWSKRFPKDSKYQEALAECPNGCGMWQLRYYDGIPTSDPYQVHAKAQKTKSVSARLSPERYAAIIALWGSFQAFVDEVNVLPCITRQYKL